MNIISSKGFIFTTDLIISIILILIILLTFSIYLNNETNLITQSKKISYLTEKTIFVADAFIKNFDKKNALFGACYIDLEKGRIKSNELNSFNFLNIKQIKDNKFFVKKIFIEKNIFFDNTPSENCLGIKRFVLVDGIKKEVEIIGCLYE